LNTDDIVQQVIADEEAAAASAAAEAEAKLLRQRHITEVIRKIRKGEKHFEKDFAEAREAMAFCRTGMPKFDRDDKDSELDDHYRVNLAKRFVQTAAPKLYARNPTVQAKPKARQRYRIWSGDPNELLQAYQTMQIQPTPETIEQFVFAQSLIQDYEMGKADEKMIERMGKTLVDLIHYFMDEQTPTFKTRLRRMVRRSLIAKVGFVKIGYRREYEVSPDSIRRADHDAAVIAHRMGTSESLASKFDPRLEAEAHMHSTTDESVKAAVMANEGLTYDFPHMTDIIPDPNLDNFDGWEGAGWVAQRYYMTVGEVRDFYEVDLAKTGAIPYSSVSSARDDLRSGWEDSDGFNERQGDTRQSRIANVYDDTVVVVYEFYDRINGIMCTVCDGYDEYLSEPASPPVKFEQFYPFFAYLPNEADDLISPYPKSPVEDIRPMQIELNRLRRALREHRIANLPRYVALKGSMGEDDITSLTTALPHSVTQIAALGDNPDVNKILGQVQMAGVDPNLYDTSPILQDAQMAVGLAESGFGATSGSTATEASLAEQSHTGLMNSASAALDDFLTVVARASAQTLQQHMTADRVQHICGEGAVWPMLSMQDIADELQIGIQAGSSGKPDQQLQVANFERLTPLLMQIPQINPTWLARQAILRLDDNADLAEAMLPPSMNISIQAMNMAAKAGGHPNQNPAAEAQQGANNAPQGVAESGGSLPMVGTANPEQPI